MHKHEKQITSYKSHIHRRLQSHSSLDTNWPPSCCFRAIHHNIVILIRRVFGLSRWPRPPHTTHLAFRVNRLNDHGEICVETPTIKSKKAIHSVEDLSNADNWTFAKPLLWTATVIDHHTLAIVTRHHRLVKLCVSLHVEAVRMRI